MKRKRQYWILVAVLAILLGGLGTIFGSRGVARNDAQMSQQLFASTSASVVSTLNLDIQHEQDLVYALGAHFATAPNDNQREFSSWLTSLEALKRYPELIGVAEIALVRHPQLASFESQVNTSPGHPFQIIPAGQRAYYCFARAEVSRSVSLSEPPGLDFCATPLGPLLMNSIDSGQGAYIPGLGSGASLEFVVGTPIYKLGAPISTVALRRAAFLGWTGLELVPHALLVTVLDGRRNTAIQFKFSSGKTHTTFRAGVIPRGAQSKVVSLHNGWSVRVYAVVDAGKITANTNALELLAAGFALSLLLGGMIYTLGTGRARALALVKERTVELEHQALHDPLTGLPNRTLVLDRIDRLLARARRENTNVALLFIDLDDFKYINDTLLHGGGDQLLVEVGRRLTTVLRDGDTVGRLSGDEFVILGAGGESLQGAETLARRVLAALGDPFVLENSSIPLYVAASIGIAQGVRARPEDLLRDADIAMYQAKDLGKNRAVSFIPSMQEEASARRKLVEDTRRETEGYSPTRPAYSSTD